MVIEKFKFVYEMKDVIMSSKSLVSACLKVLRPTNWFRTKKIVGCNNSLHRKRINTHSENLIQLVQYI